MAGYTTVELPFHPDLWTVPGVKVVNRKIVTDPMVHPSIVKRSGAGRFTTTERISAPKTPWLVTTALATLPLRWHGPNLITKSFSGISARVAGNSCKAG